MKHKPFSVTNNSVEVRTAAERKSAAAICISMLLILTETGYRIGGLMSKPLEFSSV